MKSRVNGNTGGSITKHMLKYNVSSVKSDKGKSQSQRSNEIVAFSTRKLIVSIYCEDEQEQRRL